MNTEQHGSTHGATLRKACPACGQALGWRRFLWWSLLPTGRMKLQCPSCHAHLRLHSSVSSVLLGCLLVALLILRWLLPMYVPVPQPLSVVFGGILGFLLEYLVLALIVILLFNVFFVSVKLQDEKA